VIEDPKDEKFMWEAITKARSKAHEHHEYSIRLDDPNDLTIKGMERLRRGEPGFFTEEDIALFQETVHDMAFELGTLRGAEEMLERVLERLGVESLAEAESCVQKGKEGDS
jgi:hypothetical protein